MLGNTATDKTLKAWLAAGAVDRSVGDGLTFVAKETAARSGKASWVLRYRLDGRYREKVLGRYPSLSLKDAREQARRDRALLEQGVDVAAAKQAEQRRHAEIPSVEDLGVLWWKRHIESRYKHPEVVRRVLRNHITPTIGNVLVSELRPTHVDAVLTRILAAGAPTVANDALRYMVRMFHFAVKRRWIEHNPAANFDISDAGGPECPRERWLTRAELQSLAIAMQHTPNFGRVNELSVWLLLALCVRKMELLSAKWEDFDLDRQVWSLLGSRTKTRAAIEIPLATPVVAWLREVKVFACGSPYLFPARRLVSMRLGEAQRNRFPHVGPDTLNVALARLHKADIGHFTVHDMRRTARTHRTKPLAR